MERVAFRTGIDAAGQGALIPVKRRLRWAATLAMGAAGSWASIAGFSEPLAERGGVIAAGVLALWLFEVVPAFVPTLALLVATPLVLGGEFTPVVVMSWVADPILALFFGGFVLGEAASVHGIDRALANASVRAAHGNAPRLVVAVALSTVFLSMWMSNIAAAALMLACIRPLCPEDGPLRRVLLLTVAMAANLGGMATPIASGPNGIAIAAIPGGISFGTWMVFAVPLMLGTLGGTIALLLRVHGVGSETAVPVPEAGESSVSAEIEVEPTKRWPKVVGMVAIVAIVLWVSEPWHHVSAALVALGLATILFGTGWVPADRLRKLDWSTLILIAGGVALGKLAHATDLMGPFATVLGESERSSVLQLALLLLASAGLSAVMSNTGTTALLAPLSVSLLPDVPTAPILVALASTFGVPFVVSTPPNAMAVGAGARGKDLLLPGMILLVGGCFLLTATGPFVMGWLGVGG